MMTLIPSPRRVPFGNVLPLIALLLAGDCALRRVGAQHEADPPKALVAQEFRLVDKNGKTQAALTANTGGAPALTLYDKDGKMRAALRVRADGSATFSLHDEAGRNRAALDTLADGSASLSLSNKEGKGGAAMVILPDGNPVALFKDKNGKVIWAEPQPALPPIEIKPEDGKP